MKMKNKNFNLVIVGVGGQGQITLLKILSHACLAENYDVKTSELHGLSQRGGSVEAHLRAGKIVFSPLVCQAGADLVLSLELQESLRGLYYASSKTKFLINDYFLPIPQSKMLSKEEIFNFIKKFTQEIEIVPAQKICREKLNNEILAGVYLLALASKRNLIPLKPKSIIEGLKKVVPSKHLESNLKAFNLV
jgi:indolepyruvate ferredoxin oxidoreductase beta subunit